MRTSIKYYFILLVLLPAHAYTQTAAPMATDQHIKLIELRNYLIKPGQRDAFIRYFADNFIESQNSRGGYILGRYRVSEAPDRFFWIRGFRDMASRSQFLNDFYLGPFWKAHRDYPNSVLLNNDLVYLLKPVDINTGPDDTAFNMNWFRGKKGMAVVDFYISNTRRDQLISFFRTKYRAVLQAAGMDAASYWISETEPNDFKALPVFQDPNLLVQISFYNNEKEYHSKLKTLEQLSGAELKTEMADLITIRNTMIIYPTENEH